MRKNTVKQALLAGETVINAWLSIPSAYAAEGMGHQGFDSITIDLQHGMVDFSAAVHILQAISTTPAIPLVRSPGLNPEEIMHLLDAGAYGVICPMVSSRKDAEDFVACCRYPRAGRRSFGPSRGLLYGGADYFDHANEEILTVAMIETKNGVENIEAILGVEGLDMIYVGPNDLALELDERPGAEKNALSETSKTIAHVLSKAKAMGIPAGIFCFDHVSCSARLDEGFQFVTPGNDFGLLMRAAKGAVESIRSTAQSKM